MLLYNLRLALLSIRRHPILSSLMIAAIGVGIAACITMLNVYYLSAKNPIPEKSSVVFAVQLDNTELSPDDDINNPERPPQQLTYTDTLNLLEGDLPLRQAAMFKAAFAVQPQNNGAAPFLAISRITGRDFFSMFDVPFLYGGAWSDDEAQAASQVVVLTRETNDILFGGEDSTGRTVVMDEREFRVSGVIDDWQPSPLFYDITNGPFNDVEDMFMPFSLAWPLQLDTVGNTNCNGATPEIDSFETFMASECRWISYWVEFSSARDSEAYGDYIKNYIDSQKALGRYEKPANFSVLNVEDYLLEQEVVDDSIKIMVALSFLFLVVCLLNTIGLMLAKLLARTPQIALRRALGASRLDLIRQYVIEIMLVGLFGGLLGILLSIFGLQGIKSLMRATSADAILFEMDWTMVFTAIGISLLASLIVGLYPAIRVSGLAPATSLKTQ